MLFSVLLACSIFFIPGTVCWQGYVWQYGVQLCREKAVWNDTVRHINVNDVARFACKNNQLQGVMYCSSTLRECLKQE